ncbi:RNA polymerase sigma factor [Thalassotalea piscium]|uniref:RNA polymerase sigma-70 factor (ECF subfamily) n=1 Tax=Thalassotalea piscium TaxID=1230533 RepID=A0A7X0NJK4_9GAMM|nr:RNA polymerase sigma factor [Thalassotalea piscium]MBB6544657.1 RNA polymerase sigma-70 factor (ECF subfamily) [Thalassotalea piscium]
MESKKVIHAETQFSQNDEDKLISAVQQGDQQAFHQLYLRYYKRMYALCWRMLADKDSAEDVCQEIFVQLWQKIYLFKGESKFSTWLHSVATNIVLGHLRKQKNWLQKVFSIEDKGIEDTTVEMAELPELDKKIMRLPERARLVFVLFAIEGYRHEEIAGMLGMAVGSSKSQYHRARSLLRQWVEL